MNPKQQRFCAEYAKTGNATAAYKSAYGLSDVRACESGASRLLANCEIQKYLRELSEEIKSQSIASVAELQRGLTAIFRGQTTTPLMTKDGEVVQVPVSAKDRLKAAELLCKTHGAFLTRQELNISESIPIVIKDNI